MISDIEEALNDLVDAMPVEEEEEVTRLPKNRKVRRLESDDEAEMPTKQPL